MPASGRRCPSTKSWAWRTCRSKCRPHDYYGGERPGTGLFGESIVAVDLRPASANGITSSCTTACGTWTFHAPPILADITVNGRTIKALAQPTKQALLYVFNRETGEPIWPIEERPVPKGDTPGEWYSPTQPIPTKPRAVRRRGLTIDDLIDFTPELRAEAEQVVSKYRIGPMFTPPSVSRAEGPIATLTMGAQAAATNWPGGSYDPETHTVYVASQTSVATSASCLLPPAIRHGYFQGTVLAARERPAARVGSGAGAGLTAGWVGTWRGAGGGSNSCWRSWCGWGRGGQVATAAAAAVAVGEGGGGGGLTVQGLPLIKPPYSRITAINLDTGEFRWQVPFGATPDNIRNIRR